VPLHPATLRNFRCRCGRPVFFGNTRCLACGTELGYDPDGARLLPLLPGARHGTWRRWSAEEEPAALYKRCANHPSAMACSWLIPAREARRFKLCRSCRLDRTIPDLSLPENQALWARVEIDKQRLVAALIVLGLPVASRLSEDPERGLVFDLLRKSASPTPILIGHADGVITLDVDEADDAHRAAVRDAMHEPYRTMLGHLRHESGHYYWSRLVDGNGDWLDPFRRLFGDEREDYAAALQRHHSQGPPADWAQRFVSAYASAHPWEDWAETWAHYLHISDTLDTALSFGLDATRFDLLADPFPPSVLQHAGPAAPPADDAAFLGFVNAWVELASVLNELARSMGERDLYPFVLPAVAVTKLHFVHRVIASAAPAARR
jgi:hypothetical protein